jgi:NitT/TauT family transport system substrate-binding protein
VLLHRRDFITLAALAALGEAACITGPAAADEPRVVRVLEVPTDGAKSVLYAQRANLFRKRGISADIVPLGSGAAIFAAVLGGSADFGSGSLFPVFAAYAHGVPLRIIAPASIYSSDHADTLLLVQKESPIRSARDLSGKIMGADAPNDIYVTSTRAWIDQQGGDGKSLRPVELKATEQLAALEAGRIDLAVLKPPYLTIALGSGKFRVLGKPLDVIAPRFLLSCWVATVDYIAKNPDIVNAFVAGLTEAARYTNAHQAETVDMVAAFSGQDPSQLRAGVRSITAEGISLPDVQRPLDFALKYGFIDKTFDVNGILAASVPLSRQR